MDCPFVVEGRGVFVGEAFVCFLGALARRLRGLRLLGRVAELGGPCHYRLDGAIEFVPLPSYPLLTDVSGVVRAVPGTLARMWRVLGETEGAFALGPQPYAIAFALMALMRGRALVLGVRQHFPAYVRYRHPGRAAPYAASLVLEAAWRLLARRAAVVAIGSDLAARYRRSARVLESTVSLVGAADVEAGRRAAARRSYDGRELVLLTVGRIDAEKNPLLLPEILAALRQTDPRWRLIVCGEGSLAGALERRLEALGLSHWCELRGYVPLDGGLLDLYRTSHAFLHVSRTEGLPQVLLEAYASGLPTVATAVGGVRALETTSLLIPPDDVGAAADAVQRLLAEPSLRERLISAALERAGEHTLETEAGEVAQFLRSRARRSGRVCSRLNPLPVARSQHRGGLLDRERVRRDRPLLGNPDQ